MQSRDTVADASSDCPAHLIDGLYDSQIRPPIEYVCQVGLPGFTIIFTKDYGKNTKMFDLNLLEKMRIRFGPPAIATPVIFSFVPPPFSLMGTEGGMI